ncbi:amino acid permease [Paractinoplanes deccanensis]|uniref:Amino acid permease n=1 Tax=Paractinoplanes deccanensis TaxID=113561 RepID=A0ABQ3Y614_9ACTN|nr:GerAB/ArcD/ProY family transporter [Actinoplanes deccanensis]GID75418.1 amino acid permease [Actinoplanes deccanensis]
MSTTRGVAVYVAAIVGPGILTLPAIAARRAGPASLLALAFMLAVSALIAATFVALARRVPVAGGVAAYAERAFGLGRLAGFWFYLGVPVGVTALGLIAGGYVSPHRPVQVAVAAGVVAVALLSAARGQGAGGRLPLVLTGLLVVLVLATAAVSLPHATAANLRPFAPHGWGAVVAATVPLVWVLTGWEAVTPLAHRLRRPGRVAAWTLTIVAVLFAAVAVPQVLVLGPTVDEAPVASLLRVGVGAGAGAIAAVFALVVATGNAIAYTTGIAEIGMTLGLRRRLVVPALIMVGGLAAAAVFGVGTAELVALCAGSQVPVYVLGLAAGVKLLPRGLPRVIAVVATVTVSLLLIPVGWYLLAPAVIAAVVGAGGRRRRGRRRESPLEVGRPSPVQR